MLEVQASINPTRNWEWLCYQSSQGFITGLNSIKNRNPPPPSPPFAFNRFKSNIWYILWTLPPHSASNGFGPNSFPCSIQNYVTKQTKLVCLVVYYCRPLWYLLVFFNSRSPSIALSKYTTRTTFSEKFSYWICTGPQKDVIKGIIINKSLLGSCKDLCNHIILYIFPSFTANPSSTNLQMLQRWLTLQAQKCLDPTLNRSFSGLYLYSIGLFTDYIVNIWKEIPPRSFPDNIVQAVFEGGLGTASTMSVKFKFIFTIKSFLHLLLSTNFLKSNLVMLSSCIISSTSKLKDLGMASYINIVSPTLGCWPP